MCRWRRGYSTELRSNSQGKAECMMALAKYEPVTRNIQDGQVKKYAGNWKG